MKSKIKISYSLRSNYTDKNGLTPIIMRVSLNGERISFGHTGVSVRKRDFSRGKVLDSDPESFPKNKELENLSKQILYYTEVLPCNFSLSMLKQRFLLDNQKIHIPTLEEMMDLFMKECCIRRYERKEFKMTSVTTYVQTRKKVQNFLKDKRSKSAVSLGSVNEKFIKELFDHLLIRQHLSYNTAVRHLDRLKTMFNYACSQEWISKNPFNKLSFKLKEKERAFMLEAEIEMLVNLRPKKGTESLVRDLFLFSCFTGVSYCDIFLITKNNICTMNGQEWILLRRKKTNSLSKIPVLQPIKKILQHYTYGKENDESIFPHVKNGTLNRHIRLLCKKAGITKQLSFHCARHTYATLMLTKGISIESVAHILGHRKLKTTQIYARVLPDKILQEVKKIESQFQYTI